MRALDTGETAGHYLDSGINRAQIAGRLRRSGTCSREGACVLRKSLSVTRECGPAFGVDCVRLGAM